MLKKIILTIFPLQTSRGRFLKKQAVKLHLAKPFHFDLAYQQWMEQAEKYTLVDPIRDFINQYDKQKPLFSIIVPMYNTPQKYLEPLMDSIKSQSFIDWELILADGSTDKERTAAIKDAAQDDARIKYHKLHNNQGISDNTNQGLSHVTGTFVVFMDHDDTLSLAALNELAAYVIDHPDVEVLYTDEDKITDDGVWRHSPHFKPDWSPHQFLNCNYTSHLSAVRRTLVELTSGLNTQFNGAQDYEFLLRIHNLSGERIVGHVPKILYHWREADGSTAADFSVKSYAIEAGRSGLERYLKERHLVADVKAVKNRPGFYEPIIQPLEQRKALVVVGASKDQRLSESMKNRLEELTETNNLKNVNFVTRDEYVLEKDRLRRPLHDNDCLVFVNDMIIPRQSKWLELLCGVLEMQEVYAVAPRITGFDGRIRDMGLIQDREGVYQRLFQGLQFNDSTHFGHTEWIRDVDALSGDFYVLRKKDDDARGGQDSNLVRPKDHRYSVIWSPVEGIFIGSRKGLSSRFNENLEIINEGAVSTLWKRK